MITISTIFPFFSICFFPFLYIFKIIKTDWLIKLYPPKGTGTGSAYVLAASTTCDWSLTARWRWSCRACWPGATLASTPAPSPTRWARFRPAPASPSNRSGRQHLRRPTGPASPPITTPSLSGKLYNLHIQQPFEFFPTFRNWRH